MHNEPSARSVDATIVIATKDRKEDLRKAIRSSLKQTADVEVLVVDDCSSDGTSEMVRADFPEVRLLEKEESAGYIRRRNQGARLARGTIIFSIDDDAEFSSPRVVEQTLADFDHPRVGAVAIPYIDVRKTPRVKQQAPLDKGVYCSASYIGTAHALRRDLFLSTSGYSEHFVHQGEEMDYSIRMLDKGCVVRLGRSDVIYHYESPQRSFERMDYYARRNEILFYWQNAPQPYLPLYLAAGAVNTVRTAVPRGRYRNFIAGTLAGYRDCFKRVQERQPVKRVTFQLYQHLRRQGPISLNKIVSKLERISPCSSSSGAGR